MRRITVTINGEPHEVAELPARSNAEWRKRFEAELGGVIGLLRTLPATEINTSADLVAVAANALPVVFAALEDAIGLACEYDPAFGAAYDSEVAEAYPALLGLAFPFDSLVRKAPAMFGATQTPTTKS